VAAIEREDAPSQRAFVEFCGRAGITIADPALGIGRELTYRAGPARTIVVHFIESDFPGTVKTTLAGILQLEPEWILLSRYGAFQPRHFIDEEKGGVLDLLVERYPTVRTEGDDQYLVSKNGKVLVSYDHHLFENGLVICLADVPATGVLLSRLNEMAAEIELYSKPISKPMRSGKRP